jgi:hypothetical protein
MPTVLDCHIATNNNTKKTKKLSNQYFSQFWKLGSKF